MKEKYAGKTLRKGNWSFCFRGIYNVSIIKLLSKYVRNLHKDIYRNYVFL